jgi:small conductance mechanosensitive channel
MHGVLVMDFTMVWDVLKDSLAKIISIVLIGIGTIILVKITKKVVDRSFEKSSKYIKVDPTHYSFLKHFLSGLIYVIGMGLAIYTIPQLRTLSVSLFAGAGILAVIVGFASQAAFSNIVSGIFIALFKPFRIDDRIKIGNDIAGVVEDITLRHTVIKNFENKRIIIPNAVISTEKVENASIGDSKICKFIDFEISYDSDINKAIKVMQEEVMKHPNVIDNRPKNEKNANNPVVPVRVLGMGNSSVNLRAWAWAKDPPSAFLMGCDLNKSIKERFDKEGIEIPFPYRTIVYKKDQKKK